MVGVLVVVVVWMLIVVVFDVMCFLCGWLLVVGCCVVVCWIYVVGFRLVLMVKW